jgi:hypothetical protein
MTARVDAAAAVPVVILAAGRTPRCPIGDILGNILGDIYGRRRVWRIVYGRRRINGRRIVVVIVIVDAVVVAIRGIAIRAVAIWAAAIRAVASPVHRCHVALDERRLEPEAGRHDGCCGAGASVQARGEDSRKRGEPLLRPNAHVEPPIT